MFGYYKLVTGVKNVNLLPGRGALKKQKQQGLYRKLLIIPLVLVFIIGLFVARKTKNYFLNSNFNNYF